MSIDKAAIVDAHMLIRKPVEDVFEAFVNPDITTRFWFTKSSGKLQQGEPVTWEWEMYGAVAQVQVIEIEKNKRIVIEWDEPACPVEWEFEPQSDGITYVKIRSWGFSGNDDEMVAKAIDSMGGFTLVLAGLKALLEHGIELNLVADHVPENCPH